MLKHQVTSDIPISIKFEEKTFVFDFECFNFIIATVSDSSFNFSIMPFDERLLFDSSQSTFLIDARSIKKFQ